ncbi:MAG: prolipoprotein diacylglyceryl transferase [Bdellovibrionales bacterium]|nr:prolipoprotein diacylglyceryl transferase [Bdellovibrionales bacterium]
MIPYFTFPTFEVLNQTVSSFGILVTIGLFFGHKAMLTQARRQGLPQKICYDLVFYTIIAGFIGAHLFHGFFYEKPFSWRKIFLTFHGLSSMGGFIGGWLGGYVFLRIKDQPVLRYADVSLWALVIGMFWGRLGCFSVHDHPGKLTNFFLGVTFPGGARHDLGLYEALFLLFLILWLKAVTWKKNKPLLVTQTILIGYGVFRFAFDFLRATDLQHADARYWGLTPAQYVGIGWIVIGFVMVRFRRLNH